MAKLPIEKHNKPDAHWHKYIGPLNNTRLELVTLPFNKVRPTDQSNGGCLGPCSHPPKRLRMPRRCRNRRKSDAHGPAPAPDQPIGERIAFHSSLKGPERTTTGCPAPLRRAVPRPSIILASLAGLLSFQCPPPQCQITKIGSLHRSKCDKRVTKKDFL